MKRTVLLAIVILFSLPLSPARSAEPIAFSAADSYAVGSTPFRMATGDLDGDGDLDVVVAHDTNKYSVLLNNGSGGFTATTYTAGSRLRDVAIAFINLDSIPDLAFTDYTSNLVRTFIGVGDGTFTAGATYATVWGADGIVTADFNADGRDDIAACARGAAPKKLSVFLGQAGGGLGAMTDYDVGGVCMELAVGQVDPGPLDLVTANYTSDNIGVLLGNGSGGFGGYSAIAAGNDNYDLALGDINNDGLLDAAVGAGGSDNVRLLLGNGIGGFVQAKVLSGCNGPHQVQLVDLNGNGWLDVVAACRDGAPGLAIWLQYGYLNFTAVINFNADNAAPGLIIATLDGQTLPDIATAQANNTIRVLKQIVVDADLDLIADVDETIIGTDPGDPDSDDDLMPDGWEVAAWCVDPFNPDAGADGDGDLVTNLDEYHAATLPCNMTDSDADGLPNGWEALFECMLVAYPDASVDYDVDGRLNLDEYRLRSTPCAPGDTDGDGMPNWWEDYYSSCGLDKLVGDSTLDPDADAIDNLAEYLGSTNPCVQNDTDLDGMPDVWETAHPCMNPSVNDATFDYDNDYVTNLAEYTNATDPCVLTDSDSDLMPDGWEDLSVGCGLNKLVPDAGLDPDLDTITNLDEYLGATDPCVQNDTDLDGMPDVWENLYPCMQPDVDDAWEDYDADLLNNWDEYDLGLNPCVAEDTDADGMPDGWEYYVGWCGLGPLVPDGDLDADDDHVSNLSEYQNLTDPCDATDSDEDGLSDDWENQYACMQPNVNDRDLDYDNDSYHNIDEYTYNANPCVLEDTDSDGMPDGYEVDCKLQAGAGHDCCLDKLVPEANLDSDSDGVDNITEYNWGTWPCTSGGWPPIKFKRSYDLTLDAPAGKMASGDLNADGKTDLIVAHDNGNYTVLLNQGDGKFTDAVYDAGWWLDDVEIFHLAGDTIPDLALCEPADGVLLVYQGVGNGTFNFLASYPVPLGPFGLAKADFNADGIDDLATCNGGSVGVFLGQAGGGLGPRTDFSLGGLGCDDLAVGAFNDGPELDIITFTPGISANLAVLLGDGAGGFTLKTDRTFDTNTYYDPVSFAAGDIDGDGKLDVAITQLERVTVFFGDGAGDFAKKRSLVWCHDGPTCKTAAFGDLNGGGALELVLSLGAGDNPDIFRHYGGLSFDRSDLFYSELHPFGAGDVILFADLDSQYPLDMVVAGYDLTVSLGLPLDPDGDLISFPDENDIGTNPASPDTDGDGMVDGYENDSWGCTDPLIPDAGLDPDEDELSNLTEYQEGLNPCESDTDFDSLPDPYELQHPCLDPTWSDGFLDSDGDYLDNWTEYLGGLDPCDPDTDDDGYVDGFDCGPTDPNNWDSCSTCLDTDADTWFAGCDRYFTINGSDCDDSVATGAGCHDSCSTFHQDNDGDTYGNPAVFLIRCFEPPGYVLNNTDCSDANPNVWDMCATCLDADADTWFAGCDRYLTINGPDCAPADNAHWSDCGLCVDGDGDNRGTDCNLGADCAPADNAHWSDCGLCVDSDGDNRGTNCNLGADCDDLNLNTWNTCASCVDVDLDGWFLLCNAYNGISGPDCSDTNTNVWNMCATCVDADFDTWYVGCNRYQTINGPDCDNNNTYVWNVCPTCNDDDADTWYESCDRYSTGVPPLVTIGSGNGTWNHPFRTSNHDARTQVIYLASEIGGAGTITAVALNVSTIPDQVMNSFTIRMKHTALDFYSTNSFDGFFSGWVTVYQNNEPRGATGWRIFTLTTPFTYNGTSNLMVDFSFNNTSATSTGYVRYTNSGQARSVTGYSNSTNGSPLNWMGTFSPTPTLSTYIPNLRLSITALSINGPDCDDNPTTGPTCHASCPDFHADADSDLFGNAAVNVTRCVAPAGYVVNDTDCNDAANSVFPLAPELCDTIDNQCPGDPGYGLIDEVCDPDGDGLSNLAETTIYFTNPNDPDTDHDGVDDGDEVNTYGTLPLNWDSDGDGLPDGFEVDNLSGHTVGQNLNPLNNADGPADFDGDGNPNVHELWNGTDLWAIDPVPDRFQNPGCYYWAEGDGDGVPGPGDLAAVRDEVASGLPEYLSVLPRGVFDTQDVDKDGVPGPGDISSIKDMVTGIDLPSGYPSMPVSLGVVSAPGGTVDVGDTCHVTLEVVNQALAVTRSGAFAVVFSIDPASTGSAVLLGGEGEDLGQSFANRYDVSGLSTAGGKANIVLKVTSPGTVIVRAKIPACGVGTAGRWCAEVLLSPAVTVTVQ